MRSGRSRRRFPYIGQMHRNISGLAASYFSQRFDAVSLVEKERVDESGENIAIAHRNPGAPQGCLAFAHAIFDSNSRPLA